MAPTHRGRRKLLHHNIVMASGWNRCQTVFNTHAWTKTPTRRCVCVCVCVCVWSSVFFTQGICFRLSNDSTEGNTAQLHFVCAIWNVSTKTPWTLWPLCPVQHVIRQMLLLKLISFCFQNFPSFSWCLCKNFVVLFYKLGLHASLGLISLFCEHCATLDSSDDRDMRNVATRKFAHVTHARRIQRDLGLFVAPLSKTADEPPPFSLAVVESKRRWFRIQKKICWSFRIANTCVAFQAQNIFGVLVLPQNCENFNAKRCCSGSMNLSSIFQRQKVSAVFGNFGCFSGVRLPHKMLKMIQTENFAFSSRMCSFRPAKVCRRIVWEGLFIHERSEVETKGKGNAEDSLFLGGTRRANSTHRSGADSTPDSVHLNAETPKDEPGASLSGYVMKTMWQTWCNSHVYQDRFLVVSAHNDMAFQAFSGEWRNAHLPLEKLCPLQFVQTETAIPSWMECSTDQIRNSRQHRKRVLSHFFCCRFSCCLGCSAGSGRRVFASVPVQRLQNQLLWQS